MITDAARWISLIFAVVGFLPAFTLQTRAARAASAVVAAAAGLALLVVNIIAAGSAGLSVLMIVTGVGVSMAGVLFVLFCIGLFGIVARRLARRGIDVPRGQRRVALVALIVGVVLSAAYAEHRVTAGMFYAHTGSIVARARDEAPAQSREQLTQAVLETLESARDGGEDGPRMAAVGLVGLWHPGPRKNAEYFLVDPSYPVPRTVEAELQSPVADAVWDLFEPNGYDGDESRNALPGDVLAAEWGEEARLSEIPFTGRHLLSFYDDRRFDGHEFRDGEPLFPNGRFRTLHISRIRDGVERPFLTLYAVDDGGRWWLVGYGLPGWSPEETPGR